MSAFTSSAILLCRAERKVYHHHHSKSRSNPEKYTCVIFDGMDQTKTRLPITRKIAKSTQSLYHLRTHITGSLEHTRTSHGKRTYIYIDILRWPHDCNLVIEVLDRVLLDRIRIHGYVAPTLYLQLDNCWRENKNRYMFGYCAMLVEGGVFRKVQNKLHIRSCKVTLLILISESAVF